MHFPNLLPGLRRRIQRAVKQNALLDNKWDKRDTSKDFGVYAVDHRRRWLLLPRLSGIFVFWSVDNRLPVVRPADGSIPNGDPVSRINVGQLRAAVA